jgi:hypothetical protein
MRVGEITRIVVLAVTGAFLMFVVQPLPYIRGLISLPDVTDPESWVSEYYMKGGLIVFCASMLATFIWLLFASTSKDHKGHEVNKSQPIWWIIGLIPLVGIGFAIGPYKGSSDALLSLTFFYVIDVFILYWLITATSTPGSLMYIPPFSYIMRNLIGDS